MEQIFLFILGLCIGSFLNVAIDRLPLGESLTGRSHCDFCGKKLSPLELVPVISYLVQRGKSRCCNNKLSLFYPFVEIFTAVSFVLVYQYLQLLTLPSYCLLLTSYLGIISSLIVIFFADLKYQIIPDHALVALGIFSLPQIPQTVVVSRIVAGTTLSFALYSLYVLTKRKGLGFGDVKFAFFIGLLLGLRAGFLALYLAFVTGGVFSILLILAYKKSLKSSIAFGPFIVLGLVVMLFFGETVEAVITILFR